MAVVTHSGGGIGFGAHLSFSSVVMNQKQLTGDEMAWFASIGSLAIPCGCLFVGWFMERFGRKAGLMCASVPCMIGWVLLSVSRAPNVVNGGMQIILMLVGRSFVGFGAGMNSVVGTIFVMEFSAKRLRGTLGGLSSVFISFGVLMVRFFISFFSFTFFCVFFD